MQKRLAWWQSAPAALIAGVLVTALLAVASPEARAASFTVGEFTFAEPARWERMQPRSSMRKAQFRVPNPGGDDGMVVFFHFPPGDGGSIERNLQRWASQFREPDDALGARIETHRFGKRSLHTFRASGTFIGSRGDRPDTALYAAVLAAPSGNVFVRFLATRDLAAANDAVFRRLVEAPFEK